MAKISESSEQVVKEFVAAWWSSLQWQAHETVAGAELPRATPEQLYDNLLGHTLRQIAAAAEGLLAGDEDTRGEVHEACQGLCEWMWARPGMPSNYHIPAEWWESPMGALTLRAVIWAEGDELITLSQAAEITGRTVANLSQLIVRGKLAQYRDRAEPNPQKQTRVRRSDVEKMGK